MHRPPVPAVSDTVWLQHPRLPGSSVQNCQAVQDILIGFQVERVPRTTEDGLVESEVILSSYENPEIPEQFLVVRT